jgi:short-subunit dehydrogenase
MTDIEGTVALVTGGSRGLGPYIARALTARGARVVITARSAGPLEQVAESLRDAGATALAIPCDVNDERSRAALLERSTSELGPVDILVNNAGIENVARFASLTPETIHTMVSTNVMAPLLLARAVLPGMLERRRGHIVSMSSLGGKKGSPYSATYAGTKAALIEWTAGLREELSGSGVAASVIVPGFVSEAGMFAEYDTRAPAIAGESTPEDVAAAVVRSINRDIGEIVVNPGPTRLMMVANAMSPRLMSWVLRKAGVYDFYRRQSDLNEAS